MNNLLSFYALNRSRLKMLLLLVACFAVMALLQSAHATGDGALPWEDGLTKLQESITGPVATGICLLGIVGCGAGLAFGGEMNQFVKTAMILVLVCCLIIGANSILKAVTKDSKAMVLDDAVVATQVVETTNVVSKPMVWSIRWWLQRK